MRRFHFIWLALAPLGCFGGGTGKFVESPYVEAIELYDRGKKAQAAEELEAFLSRHPDHAPAHFNLAVIYHDWAVEAIKAKESARASGHAQKARQHYARVLEIDPRNDNAHINLAALYREEREYERAADHLRLAEGINRNRSAVYLGWGALYEAQGMDDAAEAAYRQALDAQPGHPDAVYAAGFLAEKRGDPAAALPHYLALLNEHPKDLAALVAVTRALRKLQRWDEALPYYERALIIAPERVDLILHYAEALTQMERWEDAVQEYLVAKRILPRVDLATLPTNPQPLPTVEEIDRRLQVLYERLLMRR